MNKENKKTLIRNTIFGIMILGILVYFSIKYTPSIIKLLNNTDEFRKYVLSYGKMGILVFSIFQFSQILIPIIPGELVQIAGGYVFGAILGTLYTLIGTIVGTVIVFYISRIIGYPIVKIFVNAKTMEKFNFLMNSNKIEIIMLILFLIPGSPKDVLTYIAGLTPIKSSRFILISLIARIPAIIGCSLIGSNLLQKDYRMVIIITTISILFIIVGIVFRKKIFKYFNKNAI